MELSNAVPPWRAIIARSAAELYLLGKMVDSPVAATHAHITGFKQVPMQRHCPKPKTAILGNYEFRISHNGNFQLVIRVPRAPRLKVFLTQIGIFFSAMGLMVGA